MGLLPAARKVVLHGPRTHLQIIIIIIITTTTTTTTYLLQLSFHSVAVVLNTCTLTKENKNKYISAKQYKNTVQTIQYNTIYDVYTTNISQ
jgi:hypothetical protein